MFERYTTVFLAYCRTGKAVCYAESIADAKGRHGSQTDARWCGPEQYNYWRLLSDLNLGFSMIGIYGADLENAARPEYKAAFDFAAKYAGYHASPSVAPGAWVALREGSLLLKGDYSFLMRRVSGDLRGEEKVGPPEERFGAWACMLAKGSQAKFAPDPEFVRSLTDKPATVRVTYLDKGRGGFTIGAGGRKFHQELKGSGHWRTAEFQAPHPEVIAVDGDTGLTLHMIEVLR
jgi:hypothetical protein